MSTLTATIEARELIALTFSSLGNSNTWTTRATGRTESGETIDPTHRDAKRRCAEGWMSYHASQRGFSKRTVRDAQRAVQLHLPGVTDRQRARAMKPAFRLLAMLPSIPEINDRLGRQQIRDAFGRTVRALQPIPAPANA